jgi:hypothetical protein
MIEHSSDGNCYVVRADEKLTAFVELESAIRSCGGAAAMQRKAAMMNVAARVIAPVHITLSLLCGA